MPKLKITPAEIEQYVTLLVETPRRIATCTAGLSEDQLGRAVERGAWSAVEILAHLRGCEEVWSYSIYAMITQDKPALPELHPREWAKMMRYAKLEFAESFAVFSERRAELLSVLAGLSEAAWHRTARIKQHTHSVGSQIRRMALHEEQHCEQLEAMLQKR